MQRRLESRPCDPWCLESATPEIFPTAPALTLSGEGGQVCRVMDVVCGVIEDSEGRFLACLRPQGRHLGGLWEFPGGKVEPGEDPQAALARELEEELGIRVDVREALRPVEWHYANGAIRLLPYHCRILEGDPHPHEHERLLWCAPEDFRTLKWADADVLVLGQLSPDGAARAPIALDSTCRVVVERKPAEETRPDAAMESGA